MKRGADTNEGKTTSTAVQTVSNEERPLILKRVHELANCRKGIWRAALMLNQILTKKEIARQGYISLTSYYEQVCEN